MFSTLIISLSVILQFLAAGLALRLIKVTGNRLAWMFVALAVFLMAVRRSITLGRIFLGGEDFQYQPDFVAEIVALGISLCMVIGLALIGPFFRSIKKPQDELQESEQRFRLMVSEIKDYAIFTLDPSGRITSWNEGAQHIKGYTAEEIIGEHFSRFYPAEDNAAGKPAEELRVAALEGRFEDEGWRVRKDGAKFMANVIITALRDPDGEFVGFSEVTRDITTRKETEAALQESEQRLRTLIEASPVGLVLVDGAGHIEMVSDVSKEMFGYERAEVVGQRVEMLIPESYRVGHLTHREGFMEEMQARPMGKRGVLYALRKDGREFPVEVDLRPLVIRGQRLVLASIVDITARKEAEAERFGLESHLRQQQKLEAIGTLAGGVAHEINNPINGIMNYAQLISDRLDPGSPLREFAEEIGRETERVARIVRNLLFFSRQEKESHSPANFPDIIHDTVSLIQTVFRGDQILMEIDMSDDLPVIKCRSQQIQQVIMNLFTNARDALNERYPEHDPDKVMSITVRTFEKEGKPWIRTTVEDHGGGIPEELRERVFDPFFTTKDRTKGTGLGLSISHGIVLEHHGELRLECEMGRYTRFHLELPVDNGWELK